MKKADQVTTKKNGLFFFFNDRYVNFYKIFTFFRAGAFVLEPRLRYCMVACRLNDKTEIYAFGIFLVGFFH